MGEAGQEEEHKAPLSQPSLRRLGPAGPRWARAWASLPRPTTPFPLNGPVVPPRNPPASLACPPGCTRHPRNARTMCCCLVSKRRPRRGASYLSAAHLCPALPASSARPASLLRARTHRPFSARPCSPQQAGFPASAPSPFAIPPRHARILLPLPPPPSAVDFCFPAPPLPRSLGLAGATASLRPGPCLERSEQRRVRPSGGSPTSIASTAPAPHCPSSIWIAMECAACLRSLCPIEPGPTK